MFRRLRLIEIGKRRLSCPDVRQLVRQRKDLRGLGVRTVHEDQRCPLVNEREAPKLPGI
jgi:hypothetical protein